MVKNVTTSARWYVQDLQRERERESCLDSGQNLSKSRKLDNQMVLTVKKN